MPMLSVVLFFFIIIGNPVETNVHEFHLSKTTINYDSEEMAIQISTSIFIDDLELSLKEMGYDSLKICTRKEKENAELYIHEYLKEHLVVEIDGIKLSLSFLGKEQSDDLAAVWCYLEAYDVPDFKEISITNTILTNQFEDQKNITMVQVDKERIAHILFTTEKTQEKIAQ
jgi:hypothetical protein